MLKPGDPAPNPSLKTIDGQTVALAGTWGAGQQVLIVFLRHLG
jgi:peroxiredoxin